MGHSLGVANPEGWCKVGELMKNKAHLTEEGLFKIQKIKAEMNTGIN